MIPYDMGKWPWGINMIIMVFYILDFKEIYNCRQHQLINQMVKICFRKMGISHKKEIFGGNLNYPINDVFQYLAIQK